MYKLEKYDKSPVWTGLELPNSNMCFSLQDHLPKVYMFLYVYATLLKFFVHYIAA